jgi:hypothetical protein
MKLRARLIVAFLLVSVVPLGAVTIYSYIDSARALKVVAIREADELDGELRQHMQLVTAQLSQRVEQLLNVSVSTAVARQYGCVETENDAEDMFGSDRLEALLRRCGAGRPMTCCSASPARSVSSAGPASSSMTSR